MKQYGAKTVDEYINKAPKEYRQTLTELRGLIKSTVPDALERISYQMSFYEYKGRLVYFACMKDYIGLYIPPPVITGHAKELRRYTTTKSAIHFPLGEKLPKDLIKTLILSRVKINEEKG